MERCPYWRGVRIREVSVWRGVRLVSVLERFDCTVLESKGFATLRNVSKLQFFDKTGQAKSVGFRFYSAI